MATTPQAQTSTLEQAALVMEKKTAEIAPLAKGKVLRFNAPNGALYHPWDNTVFDVDTEVKHEVDDWINLQYTAGKLVLAAD